MTEMVWTTITIGGVIPENWISELADALDDEFSEGSHQLACEGGATVALLAAINESQPFHWDGHSNYGEPHDTTTLCRRLGLTYSRDFSAGGEWNAGGAFWEPGMETEAEFNCSDNGAAVMYVDDIRKHLDASTLREELDNLTRYSGGKSSIPPLSAGLALPEEDEA